MASLSLSEFQYIAPSGTFIFDNNNSVKLVLNLLIKKHNFKKKKKRTLGSR